MMDEPVGLVPISGGRYYLQNMTRYHTDDLVRVIEWVIANEIVKVFPEDYPHSWRMAPPARGTVLQFFMYRGKRIDRSFKLRSEAYWVLELPNPNTYKPESPVEELLTAVDPSVPEGASTMLVNFVSRMLRMDMPHAEDSFSWAPRFKGWEPFRIRVTKKQAVSDQPVNEAQERVRDLKAGLIELAHSGVSRRCESLISSIESFERNAQTIGFECAEMSAWVERVAKCLNEFQQLEAFADEYGHKLVKFDLNTRRMA